MQSVQSAFVRPMPNRDRGAGPELARRAVEAGAFVAIAHPEWSGLTMSDARSIETAHAVEIYNHGCAMGCDRADGAFVMDLLLSEGRALNAIATDDAHFTEPDHFGGWVMVRAEQNDPDLLLEALKNGHYYSTQGPEIRDISYDDKTITITSSAVSSMIVQGQGSAAVALHGEAMTKGTINLGRFHNYPWIRVTLIDRAGKRAWSNPIWK